MPRYQQPTSERNLDGYGAPHWYFSSGRHAQVAQPRSRPSLRRQRATTPFDLVVEGTALRVTDQAELQAVADRTQPRDGQQGCRRTVFRPRHR